MKKQLRNKKKGFTLIELIVVIVILGLLAAVLVPRFTGMRHEATVKAEGSTAASIISAARVQEAQVGKVVATGTVTNTGNAGDAGVIEKKYMIIPTGTNAVAYTITKNATTELYEVTWETKAQNFKKNQKLVEGEAFNPQK
ncbi:type IV pilin protein [Peptoanaerobacter stomatis]|uniref:type IV pilin protein n=1 Tax=Peptoanaerobacter stomatis TaxID=796937 RepID=UPI003F9EFD42